MIRGEISPICGPRKKKGDSRSARKQHGERKGEGEFIDGEDDPTMIFLERVLHRTRAGKKGRRCKRKWTWERGSRPSEYDGNLYAYIKKGVANASSGKSPHPFTEGVEGKEKGRSSRGKKRGAPPFSLSGRKRPIDRFKRREMSAKRPRIDKKKGDRLANRRYISPIRGEKSSHRQSRKGR